MRILMILFIFFPYGRIFPSCFNLPLLPLDPPPAHWFLPPAFPLLQLGLAAMKSLLLLLSSTVVCQASECSNKCSNSGEAWCNQWRRVDGAVSPSLCSQWGSNERRCLTSCEKDGEDYSWCKTGFNWEYCSEEGFTTRDQPCTGPCQVLTRSGNSNYSWCNTDKEDTSKWDYCSMPSTVEKVHYSSNGQECSGECAQAGEDYWWCYKALRWGGKHKDAYWGYCSPSPDRTRYNKPCLDECATRGSDNFWCNIAGDTWDYCSPAVPAESPRTAGGMPCHGACDYFSSSYQYCTAFTMDYEGFWDYCGASSSNQVLASFWLTIALITSMYNTI